MENRRIVLKVAAETAQMIEDAADALEQGADVPSDVTVFTVEVLSWDGET